jgi:hypothetical protein
LGILIYVGQNCPQKAKKFVIHVYVGLETSNWNLNVLFEDLKKHPGRFLMEKIFFVIKALFLIRIRIGSGLSNSLVPDLDGFKIPGSGY